MPNAPKTKHRSVRIEDQDWADLAERAPSGDRASVIKDLVRWYLRRPDAELPDRPFAPLPRDFEPINTLDPEQAP
jgi:hypothetical protein